MFLVTKITENGSKAVPFTANSATIKMLLDLTSKEGVRYEIEKVAS